jgi:hypothetical protein
MRTFHPILILVIPFLAGCAGLAPTPTPTPEPTATPTPAPPGAGFRFSSYGVAYNPGPEYWASVGEQMAAKFPAAQPEAIWIVGTFTGDGTYLNFQGKTDDPYTRMGFVDMNESALALFDRKGFKVWLQVEPGNADMLKLIPLVLERYKQHPSIAGFGVDVEWYKSDGSPEGSPVSDAEAEAWVEAVRAVDPDYKLFLKHWDYDFMPPTYRDGILFVDDSQQFESLEHLKTEFAVWGRHFAPAPVGFQYGYPADRAWWKKLQDPPGEIGRAILESVPNTSALFWVDFSVLEVFPP